MSTKKIVIIASSITVVAGTLVWFLILRKGNGISAVDRVNVATATQLQEGVTAPQLDTTTSQPSTYNPDIPTDFYNPDTMSEDQIE